MEINTETYHVFYDPQTITIHMEGSLRLRGMKDYSPISQLLSDVALKNHESITLDVCKLRFLNSSGINVLFRFVIQVRDLGVSTLRLKGSVDIPWQQKSLANMQRLMSSIQFDWS